MDLQELETLKGAGLKTKKSEDLFLEKQKYVEGDGSSDTECGETEWMASEKINLEQERGVWANKLEFFLAIMGYTIGIGSVWRFPIICR